MRRFAPETIPFRRLLDSTRRWTVLLTAAAAVAATLTLTSTTATAAPATPDFGAAIDGYAAYDGQDTCDPTIKPGVRGFRTLLNEAYGTHTGYITRECSASGTSEHKEGRALDYMLNINDSGQRAIANDILSWLLATDRYGNKHANARRLGIMYMIWNRQIWKSYQASSGWQPYTGNNPHTDHIHFSFSWKGASKQTTWWTATPIPQTPRGMVELAAGELTRDGRSDLLAVEHDTGKLWLYPGTSTGGAFGGRTEIGSHGWDQMHDLIVGRFNRDGYDDLIASDSATGKLWLYPGTAAGGSFGARVEIGSSGWNHMSSLTAGDFNRDAYPDLAAVDDTTGKLWLYPGTATGGAFGQRVEIGSQGWERMHDLTTGRFNRDGYDDLIAVDSATGNLWLYPGTAAGGSFGARVVIGAGGWNGMSDLVGAEFTRDSYHDLIAVDSSTGKLWLYPGTTAGGSFGARKEIGSNGW